MEHHFTPGDRVYFFSNNTKEKTFGIVSRPVESKDRTVWARWDIINGREGWMGRDKVFLAEIPYDPTQMGDKDDDI